MDHHSHLLHRMSQAALRQLNLQPLPYFNFGCPCNLRNPSDQYFSGNGRRNLPSHEIYAFWIKHRLGVICYAIIIKSYSSFYVTFVAFIHTLLSISNILFLAIVQTMGAGLASTNNWRIMVVSSIFLMILCYLVVLLGLQSHHGNGSIKFFLEAYKNCGLMELISPVLILVSMRGETKDPWALRLRQPQLLSSRLLKGEIIDCSQKI